MTESRATVMDFTEPIGRSKYRLYIRRNSLLYSVGWNTYVRSFDWRAWIAIVVFLILGSFIFWCLVIMQPDEEAHFKHGPNVIFMLFSCIVQQGSWILPITGRAQAVLWMFWITSIILYAAYTARITSFLTVSGTTLPFTNLKEATDTPGWRIAILQGTAAVNAIRRSRTESFTALAEIWRRDPSLLVHSDNEGINRVLTEEMFSYFGEDVVMSYYLNANCSFSVIPESYLAAFLHMGMRKGLPYAAVINNELSKMASTGLLDRMSKKWWGRSNPCEVPSPYTELGFANILTAFLLLTGGMALSFAILFIEWVFKQNVVLRALSDKPIQVSGSRSSYKMCKSKR